MAKSGAKRRNNNVRRFETIVNQPISEESIAALEEFVTAAKEGRITAYAIVAKERGYSSWISWRGAVSSDRYNLLGQLAQISTEIALANTKERDSE